MKQEEEGEGVAPSGGGGIRQGRTGTPFLDTQGGAGHRKHPSAAMPCQAPSTLLCTCPVLRDALREARVGGIIEDKVVAHLVAGGQAKVGGAGPEGAVVGARGDEGVPGHQH